MNLERIKRLLKEKESIHLEFKEAATALPGNLFESICAMLNRDGGDILLGVADNGNILGIDESVVSKMITDLVNLSNNPQKLDPPFILFPQVYDISGRKIIHIQVPASSQVHKTGKIIYDRSNDGDFKVEQPHRIAEIANRKRNHYSEENVYPGLRMEDFKQELFPKIRQLIRSRYPEHPWLPLDDEKLLEVAGLWKKDYQNQTEGYTLAAALLFGKDTVIQSIIPHYKIDALVRVHNMDRYDDRLYIQTNLIDAYDALMGFVEKHLPDTFYLEDTQRKSLRSIIFREIVANLIIHREYMHVAPTTFIIYKDRVETSNANNPHGEGQIDPNNFAPFPKNPQLAKFFIQLGRAEELGSGILTTNRYIREYAGRQKVVFIEGPIFKAIVPIRERLTDTDGAVTDTDERLTDTDGAVTDTDEILNDAIREIGNTVKAPVRERRAQIIRAILDQPGLRVSELAIKLNAAEITIKRDMQKINSLVEYKGNQKTGGYFLTDYLLSKLHKKL